MKKLKLISQLLVISFFVTACSDDDNETSPESVSTLSFEIDGNAYSFDDATYIDFESDGVTSFSISASGLAGADSAEVFLNLPSEALKTYTNEDTESVASISYNDNLEEIFAALRSSNLKSTYEIKVTEYSESDQKIVGEFEAMLFTSDGEDSVAITNGQFTSFYFLKGFEDAFNF